jgi:hypothetical protein
MCHSSYFNLVAFLQEVDLGLIWIQWLSPHCLDKDNKFIGGLHFHPSIATWHGLIPLDAKMETFLWLKNNDHVIFLPYKFSIRKM